MTSVARRWSNCRMKASANGCTIEEIAKALGGPWFNEWAEKYPEIRQAVTAGRTVEHDKLVGKEDAVILKTAVEAPCLPYLFGPHTVATKAVVTKMVKCAAVELLSGFNDLRRSALVQLPFLGVIALAIPLEQKEAFRRKMADVTRARWADPKAWRKIVKGMRCGKRGKR